jgi:hypothetical protein
VPLNSLSRRSYGAVDARLGGQGRVIDFASGLRMCVLTSARQGLSVMLESTLWANGRPTAHIAAFSLLLWERLWKKQLSLAPYWSMLNIRGGKLQNKEKALSVFPLDFIRSMFGGVAGLCNQFG